MHLHVKQAGETNKTQKTTCYVKGRTAGAVNRSGVAKAWRQQYKLITKEHMDILVGDRTVL